MRFAILGNSGSGKSTLAGWLAKSADLPSLDLDSVAWEPGRIAAPRPEREAEADVASFCTRNDRWVIEGCYSNLIEAAFPYEPLFILLDPGVEQCLANCRDRPWEPHKYPSRQEQDENLGMLLAWVAEYYTRDGTMSLKQHRACFDRYDGRKVELRRQPRLHPPDDDALALLR